MAQEGGESKALGASTAGRVEAIKDALYYGRNDPLPDIPATIREEALLALSLLVEELEAARQGQEFHDRAEQGWADAVARVRLLEDAMGRCQTEFIAHSEGTHLSGYSLARVAEIVNVALASATSPEATPKSSLFESGDEYDRAEMWRAKANELAAALGEAQHALRQIAGGGEPFQPGPRQDRAGEIAQVALDRIAALVVGLDERQNENLGGKQSLPSGDGQ